MYAVIETGGKQYRVEVGTELEVELLDGGAGDSIAFDRILLIADGDAASIGRPVVANASVSGEIVRRDRGEKVISFKYRPKARRRVKKGHRQELSVVRISDIVLDGKSAAKEYAAAEQQKQTERQRLQEAAKKQAAMDAELAAKLAADSKPAKAEKAEKAEKTPAKAAAKPAAKAAAKPAAKATTKTTTTKASKADTTDKGAAKSAPKSKKSE
ncbi:MAG TPA: 50S ribosomal protein L21 [Candidatus Limnocylindrales bacterium]|nr:50S ribosomal protein L21 [Candidatus Limnocylindrales bacterium]